MKHLKLYEIFDLNLVKIKLNNKAYIDLVDTLQDEIFYDFNICQVDFDFNIEHPGKCWSYRYFNNKTIISQIVIENITKDEADKILHELDEIKQIIKGRCGFDISIQLKVDKSYDANFQKAYYINISIEEFLN